MHIRIANPNDIDFIIQSNQAMALETENKTLNESIVHTGVEAVFQRISEELYLIAEDNGILTGQLMITKEWSDWRNGYFWWIQSVYVLPEYREKGVYKQLHKHVTVLAKKHNACGIRLYVDGKNINAQKTYAALGMKQSNYILFEDDWSE